jgi:hypothetical protein
MEGVNRLQVEAGKRRFGLSLSGSFLTRRALPASVPWLEWRAPLESWLRLVPLIGFLGLCLLVFYAVELPIWLGQSSLRLGADSHTYFLFADMLRQGGTHEVEFIGLGANFIGPIAMALLLKTAFWVMIGNIVFFLFALAMCAPVERLSLTTLGLLLALNATTLVSLVTLNKEIFALTATLLLCRYISMESRSRLLLAAILIIGLLARWEQSAITLVFLFFRREGSFFRRHPYVALLALIAVITVAYPLALNFRGMDLSAFADQAQGGNGIVVLNQIQSAFGFPLVLIPKALMSLFGRLVTPTYWLGDYLNQDFTDLANQYVVHLHCLAMLLLLVVALVKGRLRMSSPFPFFMALYLIITAANPFVQPRYEYPIYVLLCFELARNEWTPGWFRARGWPRRWHPALASPPCTEEG